MKLLFMAVVAQVVNVAHEPLFFFLNFNSYIEKHSYSLENIGMKICKVVCMTFIKFQSITIGRSKRQNWSLH